MPELIPQPHGGAIRPPWRKGDGVSQGLARGGSSMRAARKKCFELLKDATEQTVRDMIDIAQCDDPRAALVAQGMILDRAWGKAADTPLLGDDGAGAPDLSHLTPDERAELMAALKTVHRLTGRGVVGP